MTESASASGQQSGPARFSDTQALLPPRPISISPNSQSWLALFETARNPLTLWSERFFQHDTILNHITDGGRKTDRLCVMHPDLVREVLENTNHDLVPFPASHHCHDVILSERMAAFPSLTASMSHFSGMALGSYFATMDAEAKLFADRWAASLLDEGQDIDLIVSDIAKRMMMRTLLGSLSDDLTEPLMQALQESIAATGSLDALKHLGLPKWLPQLSARMYNTKQSRLNNLAGSAIAAHRQKLANNPALTKPSDFLSALIQNIGPDSSDMSQDDAIRTMLIAVLSSCYAATCHTLTWSLGILAVHPDIQRDCAMEAQRLLNSTKQTKLFSSISDLDQAVLIKSVLNEVLRLYPVVPVVRRLAVKETQIGDHRITAGSTVIVAPWVLHRHASLWTDPHHFKPERFLGHGQNIKPYSYLPFGGGEQSCISFAYMLLASRLVLLHVLNLLSLRLKDNQNLPVPVQRFGLEPQTSIVCQLSLRDTSPDTSSKDSL